MTTAKNILEKVSDDELRSLMKSFLKSLDPVLLKAARRGSTNITFTDDQLIHSLSSTANDIAHNSDLLRRLHYIVDDAFGDMIDKEIERSMSSKKSIKKQKQQLNKSKLEHEGASTISQTITETREFSSFRTDVLRRLHSTLGDLVENFNEEFPLSLSSSTSLGIASDTLISDNRTIIGTSVELSQINENRHSATGGGGSSSYNISYGSDSETSYTNGSSGRHKSFMFFDDNHLRTVADNLSATRPEKVRLRALNDLLNYAPNEAISIGSWKILCPNLIIALGDTNLEIAMACLTLHSRLLAAANMSVVCETLTNLVDHLVHWFSSSNVIELQPTAISLDIQNPIVEMKFKQIRLILEFLQETTKYWMRYSESHVEHIINETVRLFSLGSIPSEPNGGRILPLHFVALLDPEANWFRTWMHATYSRAYVLRSLTNKKTLLINAYQSIVNYAHTHSQQMHMGNDGNDNSLYPSGIRKRPIGTASSDGSIRSMITTTSGPPSAPSFLSNFISPPMSVIPPIHPPPAVPASSSHYTRLELANVHFVHSLSLFEHVVCSKQARHIVFPIIINNDKQINVKDLLRVFIQIMFVANSGKIASSLCCQLFKRLCLESDTCGPLMCSDDLFDTLVKPIKQFLGSKKMFNDYLRSNNNIVHEYGLIGLADLLAAMASNDIGYQYLIRASTTSNIGSPASLIVTYVKRILSQYTNSRLSLITPDLSLTTSYSFMPTVLLSEFIYVCRLIYSRTSGLLVIKRTQLHKSLAEAFRIEMEKNSSPSLNRSPSAESEDQMSRNIMPWKETLLDNLLLFAATPKGMYLLTQTSFLPECVIYIDERWRLQAQVGKLEQYGFGYLLSQMANTPAVVARLDHSGFVEYLIDRLWKELEHVPDDLTSVFPRRFPSEPISRYALKPLLSLLSLFSSFSAAYELLSTDNNESLTPNNIEKNPKPRTLLTLLERISFVSDDTGIRSLLCYEHTHTAGLRILSIMQSDLDVQLMLEIKYNYIEKLRQAQAEMESGGNIILDQLSLARNHVLVNAELLGGSQEKNIPPWTLNEDDLTLLTSIPLFAGSMPLPDFYIIKATYGGLNSTKIEETELHRLVRSSRPDRLDDRWLNKCRHLFMATLRQSTQESLPLSLMADLLDAVVDIHDKLHIDVIFNSSRDSSSSSVTVQKADLVKLSSASVLTPIQELGVNKALNYGVRIGLVQDQSVGQQNLIRLLKALKTHLKQKIAISSSSSSNTTNKTIAATSTNPTLTNLIAITASDSTGNKLNYTSSSDAYPGFDWFSTSIFLLMGCDDIRSWRWLRTFSLLLPAGFLWHARLFNTPFVSNEMNINGLHPVYVGSGHCVELIVEQEMAPIFAAFRMSGFAISHMVVHWTKQCFWSVLDWPEIITYICVCILYGIDYQVYFCVALLRHLQQDIIYQHSSRNLLPFLKCHQIRGFSMRNAIEYMVTLEKKYRTIVMPELKELLCLNANVSNTTNKQTNV
ncbi:unnamed protein product [Rotaria sordida]|uniref:Protein broad-minded-like n=1 Tax=Rotaria sordida TaxID=392033 RepID=A0A814WRG3_9BILA|nr:unnamed protein product [Rotaria sordida]CAF3719202.1 unnamed protein product [Rotaria sordida]